jgi:uncharacterized protein YdhG (YjbR/CyaY superfamily)
VGHAFAFFSGYAKHMSIHPVPHTDDEQLAAAIAPYVAGKGTLRFSLDQPLPVELIKKVVAALYAQAKAE